MKDNDYALAFVRRYLPRSYSPLPYVKQERAYSAGFRRASAKMQVTAASLRAWWADLRGRR